MKNILIIIVSLLLVFTVIGHSKEKTTPYSVSFGADLNGNIYFADFKNLEPVDNCCTNFGNTFGLGYNIHAGFEYQFPSKLFGMPWKIDLSFAYSDLSATFNETYEFANIITGNTYTKGVSDFIIEPKLQAVIFDPGIFIMPFDNLPLSFRAGFQVGFLLGKTFSQEERLIQPDNVYFENGTRTRGQFTGDIPNAASQYFALSIGARYLAAEFGNFSLYPRLRFNYGLNNISENVDWKASAIQAGISLVYNFPEAKTEPPVPPPSPALPLPAQPPVKSELTIAITSEFNGRFVDDLIQIPITVYEAQLDYYLLPYIFYDINSDVPVRTSSSSNQTIGEAEAQREIVKAVADLMKANSDFNVILFVSSLESEKKDIVDSRISKVTDELISYKIPIDKIKVSQRIIKTEDYEHPELLEENIFVKLELLDGTDLIRYSTSQIIKKEPAGSNTLTINIETQSTDDIKSFDGRITKNKKLIKSFTQKGTSINLNNDFNSVSEEMSPVNYDIEVFAKNVGGAAASSNKTIKAEPVVERTITEKNIVNASGDIKQSQYILCYFDFDKTEPKLVNYHVLKIIKEALNQGRKITLLPLTDNLGTEEYNSTLSSERADAALKLINKDIENISISYPEKYIYNNNTAIGRILNRTIVVRIEN